MKTNKELEKELEALKKEYEEYRIANEKKIQRYEVKIYETNKELEKALLIIQNYEEKYNIERTRIFIPKTEKLEQIIINETEEIIKEEKKTNKGKKYKKRKFDYEKYVTKTIELNPEEEMCPKCGEKLVEVSSKIKYIVTVTPAKIEVTKVIKHSKKCPKCNKEDNKIYYPVNEDNLTGSILSSSLAAFIAYHKYELGIPFHHLAKHISNNVGFEISKQNLANYMAKISELLEPIYNRMKEDLLNNKPGVIHSDETTLVVSKKDEENKNRKKSYVYVYASSLYDSNRIRIYDFHESRKIDSTGEWLKGYKGIIECDNYDGYNKLKKQNENIELQKCWAHVRRRYADIVKNLKESQRKSSKAYQILSLIKELFHLESVYKEKKLIPMEIVEQRKKTVPNIKDKIYELVFNSNPVKGSALESAINYTKECWDDLFTFVNNGYVEISNNLAEVAVKPFVVQRKVFQTSGSYAGARYTSKLFSIVQTCKINNIKVEPYLEYVIENINKIDIENLLPYSKEISKIIK